MAKIKLNNNEYQISDSTLAATKADFITHLSTIEGNGLKVVVGGVEYSIDSTKTSSAVATLSGVFEGLSSGSSEPDVPVGPDVPSEPTMAAGLYETGTENLIKSWDELISEGVVHVDNGVVYTDFDMNEGVNAASDALTGDLVLPSDGSITAIGDAYEDEYWNLIGRCGFLCCMNLTGITIPNGVTSISACAFNECYSLTNLVIPDSVISIGGSAFDNTDLQYNIKNELLYLGNRDNPYLYLAYTANYDLTTAIIDDNCKLIGDYAFSGCRSLTSVEIPDSVTSIGYAAFSGCSSLTSITITDGVTTIGSMAFRECSHLTSVVIPDSVTSIGSDAFSKCSHLTSVVIPDSVTSIGSRAFYECWKLTTVTIPDSVTSIGDSTFAYCAELQSVVIPSSVTSVGKSAFSSCVAFTTVYYKGTEEQWNAITINSKNTYLTNATIHYNYVG